MASKISRRWRVSGEILIAGGDAYLLYYDVTTLEGIVSVVIAIVATIVLVVAMISIFWPVVRKQLLKRCFHGVEIFEKRKDAPRFEDESEKEEYRHIWALWHSGSIANRQDTDIGKLQRLILLHQDNPNLESLADITNSTTRSLRQDIEMLRDKMSTEEYRERVCWLRTIPMNLMTFYNPQDKDGWVFIQHLVPYEIANDRLCFILRRQDNETLFERLKEAYNKLWCSLKDDEDNGSNGRR